MGARAYHWLFDMDGVLVNFHGRLDLLCAKHSLPSPCRETWSILDSPDMKPVVQELMTDPSVWRTMAPYAKAVEAFQLVQKNKAHYVGVCSTASPFLAAASAKIEWCEKHLALPSHDVHLCSAKHFLARENFILVDDRAKVVDQFVRWGGKAILVAWPYSFDEGVTHINDPNVIVTNLNNLPGVVQRILERSKEGYSCFGS